VGLWSIEPQTRLYQTFNPDCGDGSGEAPKDILIIAD